MADIDDSTNVPGQFFLYRLIFRDGRVTHTKFGEDMGQSSALSMHVSYFRRFASLRNHDVSKATGVENRDQVLDFLTPVKIRGDCATCLSSTFNSDLRTNL